LVIKHMFESSVSNERWGHKQQGWAQGVRALAFASKCAGC
jgi:hypothetical protein